ncbi:hypothetical protein MPSEU_000536100 [Mayamaea pseudoterrestris]|nr:hypothetical protein MPSEU_000536100 [Mayamaea pseudoterrestris]
MEPYGPPSPNGKRKLDDSETSDEPFRIDKKLQDMSEEEKRAYNRMMSARARKRQKETIAGLTEQIQEYMRRNGLLEQISNASAYISSMLAEENRLLRQYITENLGPGVGPPPINHFAIPQQGGMSSNPFVAALLEQLRGSPIDANTNQYSQHAQAPVPVAQPTFFCGLPTNDTRTSPQFPCSSPYEAQVARQSHLSPMIAPSIPAASLAQALANRRANSVSVQTNSIPLLQRLGSLVNLHGIARPQAPADKAAPMLPSKK